ncbi:MAG: lipid-binding SYLF domain-containing protein [Pseudomonadota bacterium]
MGHRPSRHSIFAAIAAAAVAATLPVAANAGDRRTEATELIADAAETTAYFAADTAFEPLWDLADKAKAMVIVPESFRAGFIIGGSAGDAVMMARNDDGTWSQPTFLTVGSLSFGLQAGGEASETILLVMTERGMEQLLSTSVKLGADLSIAAGPIGAGAKAQTTDILAFSRSRGLYGGVSLEGAVLKTRRKWNDAYYNASVSPAEVIFKNEVYNPASAQLQNAVWRLAHKDAPASLAPAQPLTYEGDAERDTSGFDDELRDDEDLSDDDIDYEDDDVWGAPIGGSTD